MDKMVEVFRFPSHEDISAAIDAHIPIRLGVPIYVEMTTNRVDETAYAVPNLAAVARGEKDPWVVCATRGNGAVFDFAAPWGRGMIVENMEVSSGDLPHVDAALRLSSPERHSDDADLCRRRAGRYAMEHITDAMVRARVIDAVGGWEGVCGKLVNDSGDDVEGKLYAPAIKQLEARVLVVMCPSTGRRYAHLVPRQMKTARAARKWMMHGVEPEVET